MSPVTQALIISADMYTGLLFLFTSQCIQSLKFTYNFTLLYSFIAVEAGYNANAIHVQHKKRI